MRIAIMQPYFFPYIGYFQLINSVDEFIIYDNIEYAKKGWINRNRILVNGNDMYITLPLKKGSDYAHVRERELSDDWGVEKKKMLNRIKESYRKAPQFLTVFPIMEQILLFEETNLFRFILNSIKVINEYLGINTPITISSSVEIDHTLKAGEKVKALCKALNGKTYINPIGGLELYSKEEFTNEGIELQFLKTDNIVYTQLKNEFVPFLSIIDVMMFNTKEELKIKLQQFSLK
jgi:hypothetical protein